MTQPIIIAYKFAMPRNFTHAVQVLAVISVILHCSPALCADESNSSNKDASQTKEQIAPADAVEATMKRLNSIVLEEFEPPNADFPGILRYLTAESKRLDPTGVGIEFVIRGPMPPDILAFPLARKIELVEVLVILCELWQMKFIVEPDTVVTYYKIHAAVADGDAKSVDALLKLFPSSVNSTDEFNKTPLDCAMEKRRGVLQAYPGLFALVKANPKGLFDGSVRSAWAERTAATRPFDETIAVLRANGAKMVGEAGTGTARTWASVTAVVALGVVALWWAARRNKSKIIAR